MTCKCSSCQRLPMEIELLYKSIRILQSKEKQNKTRQNKQSCELCSFLVLSDMGTIRSSQDISNEIRKKKKKCGKLSFFMVFHIKLYECLRSFQTPFLSLLQGRASGNLHLLKDLIHSVALLIHQMHTLQIFTEGIPVQGDGKTDRHRTRLPVLQAAVVDGYEFRWLWNTQHCVGSAWTT